MWRDAEAGTRPQPAKPTEAAPAVTKRLPQTPFVTFYPVSSNSHSDFVSGCSLCSRTGGMGNQIRDHAAHRRFTLSLAPQQLENSEKSSITRAEGMDAVDTWISVKGIWFVIVEKGGNWSLEMRFGRDAVERCIASAGPNGCVRLRDRVLGAWCAVIELVLCVLALAILSRPYTTTSTNT